MPEYVKLPNAIFVGPSDDVLNKHFITMIIMPVRKFSVSQIDQVAVSLLEDVFVLEERLEAIFACKEAMDDNKGFPLFAITLL